MILLSSNGAGSILLLVGYIAIFCGYYVFRSNQTTEETAEETAGND